MTNKKNSNFFYAIFLALQLGFLIAIPLVGFLLVGVFLDKRLNSFPLFLILSIIFSFIFLFFEIRHFLLPFLEKHKN
ncbi:MAG: AtpZ/AtpI family protein [Candidatus Paceibacterales bacterium]